MPEEGSLPPYEKILSRECYPTYLSICLIVSEVITSSEFPRFLVMVVICCLIGTGISKVNRNKLLFVAV